jgi:uncharacterized glyoxalase superfamily protein PhnB
MKKVYPLLITGKLKECAAFYVEHFGFTPVFEQDWYVHLVHQESGAELGFMIPDAGSQPEELHPGFNGKGMVYGIEVDDAKLEYQRLSSQLASSMVLGLKDEPWGQRHFIVRDPAGVFVDVVQQLET